PLHPACPAHQFLCRLSGKQSALPRIRTVGSATWHQGNRRLRAGRLYRRAHGGTDHPAHSAFVGRSQQCAAHQAGGGLPLMTPYSDSMLGHKARSIAMLGVKDFTGLTSDSRKVKPGYLFAALAGSKTDGAKFVKDAVTRGAVAVLGAPVMEADVAALGVRFIPDENPRAGLARYAAAFYPGQPDIVAAVTGTKGKSSIVAFLREIWTALGKPAASLGTVGVTGPKGSIPLSHTTPDPVEIHELLARLKQDGVDHLAIEASSHGLDQHRLDGV